MNEQQKIPPWNKIPLWVRFNGAALALCRLLEHDLDETVKPAEFSPALTALDAVAASAVWLLTGQSGEEWVSEHGRYEWTIRDLARELRDDIRGWIIRLFINPTPELFDRAVSDHAQFCRLDMDKFLAQGHDESDFADVLRQVAVRAEHGEMCFVIIGSARNLGKLWADILEPFCRLFLEELIRPTKQVRNLTLILLSNDPAEQVLSRCISECLAIDAEPHVGALRYITARLLGVVF